MDVRILQRGKADEGSMKYPKDCKYFNNTHQGKTGKSDTKHYLSYIIFGRREKEDVTMVFI
jgi:hypothetical protein